MSDYNRRMTWQERVYEKHTDGRNNYGKPLGTVTQYGRFRHWGTWRNEDGRGGICAAIEMDDGSLIERAVEEWSNLRFLRDDEPGPPAPAPKMSVSARNGAD